MLTNIYYHLRPFIPRKLQLFFRRKRIRKQLPLYSEIWPINERAGNIPEGWNGWPEGKRFALILTHDVETIQGHDKCHHLIKLEKELGFKSAYYFVPERYRVSLELRDYLTSEGFEVGVHGLKHDGKLYNSRKIFNKRALKINKYLEKWQAVGFGSPSMHNNLEWIHDLNIEYDSSTFDTDPFEPQSEGVKTLFPFWVSNNSTNNGYVELPYTIPQDFTLFVLMKEKNIDIWKKKLDWIAEHGGMALIITHPDYMNFDGKKIGIDEYQAEYYKEFLEYIKSEYEGQYWNVLPKDMARFWTKNFTSEAIKSHTLNQKEVAVDRQNKGKACVREKIWIDLDNSPHVPFFKPIIGELNKNGYSVMLTARDCFQTCGLADLFNLTYKRIGKHHGKKKIVKLIGLFIRAFQLAPAILKEKPVLALSHGSRAQIILAKILGIKSIVIHDYEHAKGLPFFKAKWLIEPEVISDSNKEFVLKYPGIKEDVYVPDFKPDAGIKKDIGIADKNLVITIRPPATEAHYHNPESEELFKTSVNYLGQSKNVCMVILPRNEKQESWITKMWPEFCTNGKIIIPEHVVDGLNLLWNSDLAISGGGTMNREAAALGVPVYSIFRGKIGAVDKYLTDSGRLTLLESVEDIKTKIILEHSHRTAKPKYSNNATLQSIVTSIISVIEKS